MYWAISKALVFKSFNIEEINILFTFNCTYGLSEWFLAFDFANVAIV